MTEGGEGRSSPDPAADRHVDLHTHSTASDGAVEPAGLVERARAAGLVAVALTDHDTVDGVPEAQAAAQTAGIDVIPGVELSAVEEDREVHILGLHLRDTAALEPRLAALREARARRAAAMVAALNAQGVGVTLGDVLAHAGAGAVGRPHVARALVGAGWARDQRDAFDRYLATGRVAYVPKEPFSVADAIDLIHAAGGVAVFAHPGREGTRARLEELRASGLDGVEVRHPSHSADDQARLGTLAEFLDLVPSGGSDWHGATDGPRVLGAMSIPAAWADRQARRANAYRQAGGDPWSSGGASHS